MDQELTGNAFRRFMRRRGLSRDQRGEENFGGVAEFSQDRLQRTPSYQRDHQPIPHRSSSSHANPNSSSVARPPAGSATADADSIRRTQSTFESTHPQSPHRRPRGEADEPNKKQYRCEYCNLQFGRKHHKERHVANIHRQEKPFVCNICGHPFHQKPNLDRHRATVHAEVSPFRCDECGLTFSRRSALRNHIQSLHERNRRHECPVCREVFSLGRELNAHLRTDHPGHTQNRSGSSRDRGS